MEDGKPGNSGAGCFRHPLHGGQLGGEQGATTKIGISSGVSMRRSVGLCGHVLDLAAKGTYYLNCKTGQASISVISFNGSEQKKRIRAVYGYL